VSAYFTAVVEHHDQQALTVHALAPRSRDPSEMLRGVIGRGRP
jgi:hypothetical protein